MKQYLIIIGLSLIVGGLITHFLIERRPIPPHPVTIVESFNAESAKVAWARPLIEKIHNRDSLIGALAGVGIQVDTLWKHDTTGAPTLEYSFDSTKRVDISLAAREGDSVRLIKTQTLIRMRGSFIGAPVYLFTDLSTQIAPFEITYQTKMRDSIIIQEHGLGLWVQTVAGFGGAKSLTALLGFRTVGIGIQLIEAQKYGYAFSFRKDF